MNEPTQEQIKRFWEWCGFRFREDKEYDGTGKEWAVHYPDGEWHHAYTKDIGRLIDLTNLFKYAVPKLKGFPTVKIQQLSYGQWLVRINAGEKYVEDDSALALFWAIYKVIDKADIPLRIDSRKGL